MPKGKKKGKFEHRRTEQPYSSDEDAGIDMTIDNCSETSAQSDLKSNHDDAALGERASVKGNAWIRHMACFGSVANRPKRGTDIQVSAVSVEFNEIATRANSWRTQANQNGDSDSDDSEVSDDYTRERDAYLTLESPHLREDEWDTDNDPDSTLEDPHVDVHHQGRPSHGRMRKTSVDSMDGEVSQTTLIPEENEVQEKLEEKVLELVEGLNARAAAARAGALVSLRGALQRRALSGVLAAHRATLADHVARALRRGRDPERRAAAALAPILALQIGEDGTEDYMREVRPALAAAAVDRSASLDTRTECCSSLAVLCYLLEEDVAEILDVLRMYETIFSGSYLKGDGSVKVSGAVVEEGGWHAAALDGWALLLGALDAALARGLPALPRLAELLDACSLEVRMAAGGALAVAHERLSEEGDEEVDEEVMERLERLARDSHKYRAKRDRKLQRATFRDILKYFEEGTVPVWNVRVGSEQVSCASWGARGAYGALAAALGAGLRALLPACEPLRAALALPPPAACVAPTRRPNKLQRHLQNTAACKARTVARNKNRDKRSAALAL